MSDLTKTSNDPAGAGAMTQSELLHRLRDCAERLRSEEESRMWGPLLFDASNFLYATAERLEKYGLQPTEQSERALQFPRSELPRAMGWTIDFGYLSKLQGDIPGDDENHGDQVSLETIEAVLLAAERAYDPRDKMIDNSKVKAARAYLWHYDYGAGPTSDLDNAMARLDEFLRDDIV